MNLHRRHLTPAQRAMIAAELTKLEQGQHLKPTSADQADEKQAENGANVSALTPAVTAADAAAAVQVTRNTVQEAKTVLEHGSPSDIAAVKER